MIRLDELTKNKEKHRLEFLLAKPFPHLVIDDFCEKEKLEQLHKELPEIQTKSRDYVFAANKFEKSKFSAISPLFAELHNDLLSEEFKSFLKYITNQEVFIDKAFHGGGIHQGKKKSFLDMHLDFNLLLYLNKDWKPEYGGHLKIQDLRTSESNDIEVPFNRMVIQLTNNYTLHGYDVTNFPDGMFRTSIASYAYMKHQYIVEKPRTTDWHVGEGKPVKQFLASIYDPAVKIKNKLFGSGTAKNQ